MRRFIHQLPPAHYPHTNANGFYVFMLVAKNFCNASRRNERWKKEKNKWNRARIVAISNSGFVWVNTSILLSFPFWLFLRWANNRWISHQMCRLCNMIKMTEPQTRISTIHHFDWKTSSGMPSAKGLCVFNLTFMWTVQLCSVKSTKRKTNIFAWRIKLKREKRRGRKNMLNRKFMVLQLIIIHLHRHNLLYAHANINIIASSNWHVCNTWWWWYGGYSSNENRKIQKKKNKNKIK